MSSQQASCLLRYGLYQPGESVFRNGRKSPYTVRLPDICPKEMYSCLAESAWSLKQLDSLNEVHCIGIANSGILLATAIHEYGLGLGRRLQYSIVQPRAAEQEVHIFEKRMTPVLVDNAVTTGKTVAKVLTFLRHLPQRPRHVIRIFDREDLGEDGLSTAERLKADLDIDLISIFLLRDLLPFLDAGECQAILDYQSIHGTNSFKEWIGGRDVL